MMSEITISDELAKLIDRWVSNYNSGQNIAEAIVKEAENTGVPMFQIRELIEGKLRERGLKDRRIQQLMPPQFKNPTARALGSKPKSLPSKPSLQSNAAKSEKLTVPSIAETEDAIAQKVREQLGNLTPEALTTQTARLDIKKFLGYMMETNRRWQVRPLYVLLKIENGEVVDMELEQKALEVRA